MSELANWVMQWGPNPWGPNSCRSIQQADLEFAKLKGTAKSKFFSQKFLKCAGAWAVWLVARSLAEEKQASQVELQNLREENEKLKAELKAQQLQLEEGKTREEVAAMVQVRSVLQYQEVCDQKQAILDENQALKEKLAVSTKAVEEVQGTIQVLVQKIQILKEKSADHRACEEKMEKLRAELEAKQSEVASLAKPPCEGGKECWEGKRWFNPDGSPSTEEGKPVSSRPAGFEMPGRFKVNPVSPTSAQVAVKREGEGAEGRGQGNVQPQADRVSRRETITAVPAPHQFKPGSAQGRRKQWTRSSWAREDGEGPGGRRMSRGKESTREKRDSEVLQPTAPTAATPQLPFMVKGRKERWQGNRPWQHGTAPRVATDRRDLSTMRVDVWRQLRKHGEDMARWDSAPTSVLLERLLEISRSREGTEPEPSALPIVV